MTHTKNEQTLNQLKSIQDCIRWVAKCLQQADVSYFQGSDSAISEAYWLVEHICFSSHHFPKDWYHCRILDTEKQQIASLLTQRIEQHIPMAYLLEHAFFAGHAFYVNQNVLIPRSPIAELIQQNFRPYWQENNEPMRILDVCTGSGCIGIACALQYPQAQVDLIDISYDALAVAETNIAAYSLEDRVYTLQSDMLSHVQGQYDLIICNPPYVTHADMQNLPEEFALEPEIALIAGIDGLDFVRPLLAHAHQHLTAQGQLILEVGDSQSQLIQAYPQLELQWVNFKQGGHGVCIINKQALSQL